MSRSISIDFYKFVSSIIIMTYHAFIIGFRGKYPFSEGDIFVEFFLFVTGFYSAKHCYSDAINRNMPECSKDSIIYTLKKFSKLLPYTIPAIVASYLVHNYTIIYSDGMKTFLARMTNLPTELLLLGAAYGINDNAPLWQLSAMLICFPLFLLILQLLDGYTLIIIAFISACLRYGYLEVTYRSYFGDLSRVMVGLIIGASLYNIRYRIDSIIDSKIKRIVSFTCMIIPIIVVGIGFSMPRVILILFMMMIVFDYPLLNNKALANIAAFLGKLSIPIYTWHWVVGGVIKTVNIEQSVKRFIVYVVMTLVIALLNIGGVVFIRMNLQYAKNNRSSNT